MIANCMECNHLTLPGRQRTERRMSALHHSLGRAEPRVTEAEHPHAGWENGKMKMHPCIVESR